MAPEIGAGKYDRSIDIYALGAVLYEMLTGMVPFNGRRRARCCSSIWSEIDTTGIPEPFAGVIKKAMAKDPAQRYQSVQEMVERCSGRKHVRQSVSVFSPDELSVVAGHAALRAAVGGGSGGAGGTSGQAAVATTGDPWERVGAGADRLTDRVAKVGDRVADAGVRVARNATGSGASSKTMEVAPSSIRSRRVNASCWDC
jgi:hypothetical protein